MSNNHELIALLRKINFWIESKDFSLGSNISKSPFNEIKEQLESVFVKFMWRQEAYDARFEIELNSEARDRIKTLYSRDDSLFITLLVPWKTDPLHRTCTVMMGGRVFPGINDLDKVKNFVGQIFGGSKTDAPDEE